MVADSSLAPLELLTFAVSLWRHRNRDLRHGLLAFVTICGLSRSRVFAVSDKILSSKTADWVEVLRIVYSWTTASDLVLIENLSSRRAALA
jgi:hypothetical protein